MNLKRVSCPNCHTAVEPGLPCPACLTLTTLDERGNIVFRLSSKPVSIPQPEPGIIPGNPVAHQDPFEGLVEEEVITTRLTAATGRGIEKPVNVVSKPKEGLPQRRLHGFDLERIMGQAAPVHTTSGPHRTLSVGPDLSALLRGGV